MAASKNNEREAREARERLRRYNARQAVHAHQIKRRKRDNLFAVGGVVVVAALATVTQIFYFNGGPGTPTPAPTFSAESQNVGDVPSPDLAEGRDWTGELTLNDTALGIDLDGAAAPQAVASFVQSVQDGYYEGTTCHRLVVDETAGLLQCGSADGTGATDGTYSFGPIENAPETQVYPAGTIAMARPADNAYGNGRQFFIVFADTVLQDDAAGGYTVFGQVTSGLDELRNGIVAGGIQPAADGTESVDGAPVVATTITGLTIE